MKQQDADHGNSWKAINTLQLGGVSTRLLDVWDIIPEFPLRSLLNLDC